MPDEGNYEEQDDSEIGKVEQECDTMPEEGHNGEQSDNDIEKVEQDLKEVDFIAGMCNGIWYVRRVLGVDLTTSHS